MTPSEWTSWATVALLAAVLVASGPLAGGVIAPSGAPTTVGDGDAVLDGIDIDVDAIAITPGRLGTNVTYLRVPDATVRLASVTDRPRLVYRVQVPALAVDETATEVVTERGTYRLHVRDVAIDPAAIENASYDGTLTVRVQSFGVDRTLYETAVTVEVQR